MKSQLSSTQKKVSRRQLLKLMGMTAAGATLAACAAPPQQAQAPGATQSNTTGATEELTAAPRAKGKIALSYWGHAYEGRVKVVDAVIADYIKDNPDVEIDHQTLPDLWDKLPAAFGAGTQPDIFSIDNSALPRYVEADQLVPIDPTPWGKASEKEVYDLFEPGTIDYLQYKGHLWGPPMEVSVHSPAYRVDHFKEYGLDVDKPPDTYEDWVEVGKRGVKRDAEGKLERQWFEWYGPGHWPVLFGPVLLSAGGWWLNGDGTRAALNTESGIRALQFFYDTIHTWKLTDPAFASPDEKGHFVTGRETYAWHNFPGSRWISTTFEGMEYGKDWRLQPMFKFADGPRKNIGYAYGFFVTKKSVNPAEAWKFIEAITHFPERTEQWIDVAGLVQTRKGWDQLPKVKDLPFVPIFNREFTWSVPNLLHPKIGEIGNEITKALSRITATPPDDPKTVADDFDSAVNAILQS